MRLENKLDLSVLWETMGEKNVPPSIVKQDCYAMGQEIGSVLLSTDQPLSLTLSKYEFLLDATNAYERSVRFGLLGLIERHLEEIQISLADVLEFVRAKHQGLHLMPPNAAYIHCGIVLMQKIHLGLKSGITPFEEIRRLVDSASIKDHEECYNSFAGYLRYVEEVIEKGF